MFDFKVQTYNLIYFMELEGQLTFDDNPLKAKFNEGLSLIQKGKLITLLNMDSSSFLTHHTIPG